MARSRTEIFDPSFVRSLEGLRILAPRVQAGGRLAEQRSRARGAGVEFTDVRPYVPGDDFRAVDWHLYQRLDKVFLRLFLEDEDLPVHVLLDESASMATPPAGLSEPVDKHTTALQAVAALAYVAAHHLDRVTVHPFAGEPRTPLRGVTGRAAFQRLLAWLADRPAVEGAGTDLVKALRHLSGRRLRRGLCIVVSDFLDPEGPAAVVNALKSLRHDLLLIRVVHPGEIRPKLQGEVEVVDSETGESMSVHVDDTLLGRYEAAYREFETQLTDLARSRRGGYLAVRTDQPTLPQIATLFQQSAHRGAGVYET